MPVITLVTDFGETDEYVGLMKGVILSVNPTAQIIDINHHIEPQDLHQAARTIEASYQYFPEGAIHVVVVDPGVGSQRDILVLQTQNYFFLAPNNGVLSLIIENESFVSVHQVSNQEFFRHPVSNTFHGRDIFAPVAGHLSLGISPRQFGSPQSLENVVRLTDVKAQRTTSGLLIGEVIVVDRFGNLITNITQQELAAYLQSRGGHMPKFLIGDEAINGLMTHYADVENSMPLAVIGSRGLVEIAINKGSAAAKFKVVKGDRVKVMVA
ncbi:MAG: SAM-dependent chlorinase/fluorinase [Desulfobacterales bacterium]|nr:SAM-dependent chlorinase/fluorinase [Desulfobacterales bacterium]